MAKIPFLSRLFGAGQEEKEPEQERQSVQEEPVREEPKPETGLVLPREHAVNRLWRLWSGQVEYAPRPKLELRGGDGPFFPPGTEKQELMRLQMAVNASANRRAALVFPKGEKQDAPTPKLDTEAMVFVTGDRLSAWLLAWPPTGGGRELEREDLARALSEAGVCWGVDEGLLDRMPGEKDRYFQLRLAARGLEAVHGRDGYVVDLFRRQLKREFGTDDYGQVDYAALVGMVQNVAEGDVICRMIPPTMGVPGTTVLGAQLPARDGRAASPPVGRNTRLSEDGAAVIANVSGHVEYSGRGFQVKPVLEIGGNVDYSTGNINFVGDVHIHGDVLSGFSVRCMGSVTVDGVVEASSIEAGGDVTVVKGIVGNDQAVVRAQRGLFAKYLENSCVYARESIQADCIVSCDVYSDGVVEVRSGRGTIIGGRIWAGREVSAAIVGAQSEQPTCVVLGGLPCEEFERDVLVREIERIEEELERTEQEPDSASKLSRLSKTRVRGTIARNRLDQVDRDLREAQESMAQEKREEPGRLNCDVAYPGTEIAIGGVTTRLRQEVRPCNAKLFEGEILFF